MNLKKIQKSYHKACPATIHLLLNVSILVNVLDVGLKVCVKNIDFEVSIDSKNSLGVHVKTAAIQIGAFV